MQSAPPGTDSDAVRASPRIRAPSRQYRLAHGNHVVGDSPCVLRCSPFFSISAFVGEQGELGERVNRRLTPSPRHWQGAERLADKTGSRTAHGHQRGLQYFASSTSRHCLTLGADALEAGGAPPPIAIFSLADPGLLSATGTESAGAYGVSVVGRERLLALGLAPMLPRQWPLSVPEF